MTARRSPRHGAGVLAAAAALALLPAATTAPAHAAAGCVTDAPVSLLDPGCDDTTPPESVVVGTVPVVNAGGWINKDTIRISVDGRHTDADTDDIALECVLTNDPATPADTAWTACPQPLVYRNLDTSVARPYVFWVRATDSEDAATTWSDGNPLNGLDDEPGDDTDSTPARLAFTIDNVAPDSSVVGVPHDPLSPELPMVTTTSPRFRLAATEVAGFRCLLNRRAVPCASGATTYPSLPPGDKTLSVQAVDRAGNLDPSPAVTRFAVPDNLVPRGRSHGWTRVRGNGYLGDDYLLAHDRGAELVFRATRFRELRLLAATGPGAGRIALRIGERWRTVDLRRKAGSRHDQVQVVDEREAVRGGEIRLRVLSDGRPVQLDGVLAH